MISYTLAWDAPNSARARYVEAIDADTEQLAIEIAQDSIAAIGDILYWTTATLTADDGAVVWVKKRSAG
jgi:hypothetical protein